MGGRQTYNLVGDQWVWPCSMLIGLLEIKNHMPFYNPNSSLEDCIKWFPTLDGIYTTASTMASLKAPHLLVPWFELVWYSHNFPTMSVILWLLLERDFQRWTMFILILFMLVLFVFFTPLYLRLMRTFSLSVLIVKSYDLI